ncbi:hypothetical protein [Nocardia spumae]|uniref:hypothetical protein n=1 Tax=Nocardia spumae TaxID=2887190 RepID=UPI001D14FBCD|nr:hypothetical protein [Nocardia spumae]
MDDRAGTGDRADADIPGRLNMKVAGPAMAAGAVSLGLVLIGACGIGHKDVYVAPPPLSADLQVATAPLRHSGTTTPQVMIPPSPSWRVAANTPARRTTSATATDTAITSPDAEPSYTPYAPPPTTSSRTVPTTVDPNDDRYDESETGTTTTTRPHYTPHSIEETEPAPPDSGNEN